MSAAPKPLSKPTKPYWEMTSEELAEATKEFDQEFISDSFRELTPAERAEWEQMKRRRKRDWRQLTVRVTPDILRMIDILAKRWKWSRSKVVRSGLDSFLIKFTKLKNHR